MLNICVHSNCDTLKITFSIFVQQHSYQSSNVHLTLRSIRKTNKDKNEFIHSIIRFKSYLIYKNNQNTSIKAFKGLFKFLVKSLLIILFKIN
jgi:hypothetical protein